MGLRTPGPQVRTVDEPDASVSVLPGYQPPRTKEKNMANAPQQPGSPGHLGGMPTEDARFGRELAANPVETLKAKGITISSADAAHIQQQITQASRPGAARTNSAKVEIGVTVGIG
jgi:hypothetical protein